jgi:drug/metabolite transporter (DMT)-like permease
VRAFGLVAALALIWGSGFFWIRLALDGLSPIQLTFTRLALGAAALAVIVAVRRLPWPRGARTWLHLTTSALISNAIPYGLFAYAEQTVPSSLAGAFNATTPLWTAMIAFLVGTDRPMATRRVLGLVLGLVGALLVLSPWEVRGAGSGLGLAACVAASASYGLSYVYQARYLTNRGIPPLVLAAAQLAVATVLLAVLLPVGGLQPMHLSGSVITAILVLGIVGSGLAYVINFAIIADEGAVAASSVTYLVPVVAVTLGVAALGEPITWSLPVGLVVVLAGVTLVRTQRRRSQARTLPNPPV